jgi:hypothetical protein
VLHQLNRDHLLGPTPSSPPNSAAPTTAPPADA